MRIYEDMMISSNPVRAVNVARQKKHLPEINRLLAESATLGMFVSWSLGKNTWLLVIALIQSSDNHDD